MFAPRFARSIGGPVKWCPRWWDHPEAVLRLARSALAVLGGPAIRRGTFASVKDLINTFIDGWNERCQPFTWTKTADQLLDHSHPGKRTSLTRH